MARISRTYLNFLLVFIVNTWFSEPSAAEEGLIFEGCGKNGWKCVPSAVGNGKYDIEYDCGENMNTILYLWSFRAPKEIYGLKISNCDYLRLDLSCGSDGQIIDSVLIYNINVLNLTSKVHAELAVLPTKFIFDQIGYISRIPRAIFKQRMSFPENLFKCFKNLPVMDSLFMTNIAKIDKIEAHAIEAYDMEWFLLYNVTVIDLEPYAITVYMSQFKQINIKHCYVEKIGYRGLVFRAHSLFVNKTTILEIDKNGFCGTIYWFHMSDCLVGVVHSTAFYLLAQNIVFLNNSFGQLLPQAFNGIGPGLLENALVSFGKLRFTYVFSRNRVYQANVGSLNPDWEAYKNVKTYLNFTMNFMPCSCADLGWLNLETGIGKGLLDIIPFNRRVMERKSQNLCIDSPCLLPLSVMSLMQFVNGTCDENYNLKEICTKFLNNNEFRKLVLKEPDKLRSKMINGFLVDENNENLLLENPIPNVPIAMIQSKQKFEQDVTGDYYNSLMNTDENYKQNKKTSGRYIRKTQSEMVKDEFALFYEQYMNAKYKNLSRDEPDFVYPIKDKIPKTTPYYHETTTEESFEIEEDPWKFMFDNENETSEENDYDKFVKRDIIKNFNAVNEKLLREFNKTNETEIDTRPKREANPKRPKMVKKIGKHKPNYSRRNSHKWKKRIRIPKSVPRGHQHNFQRKRIRDDDRKEKKEQVQEPKVEEVTYMEERLLENGAMHESFDDIPQLLQRPKRYTKKRYRKPKTFKQILKQMERLYPQSFLNNKSNVLYLHVEPSKEDLKSEMKQNEEEGTGHEEMDSDVTQKGIITNLTDTNFTSETTTETGRSGNLTQLDSNASENEQYESNEDNVFGDLVESRVELTTLKSVNVTINKTDAPKMQNVSRVESGVKLAGNRNSNSSIRSDIVGGENSSKLLSFLNQTIMKSIDKSISKSNGFSTPEFEYAAESILGDWASKLEKAQNISKADNQSLNNLFLSDDAVENKSIMVSQNSLVKILHNIQSSSLERTSSEKVSDTASFLENEISKSKPNLVTEGSNFTLSEMEKFKIDLKNKIQKGHKNPKTPSKIVWHLKTDKYTWKKNQPVILLPKIIEIPRQKEGAEGQVAYEFEEGEEDDDEEEEEEEEDDNEDEPRKKQSYYIIGKLDRQEENDHKKNKRKKVYKNSLKKQPKDILLTTKIPLELKSKSAPELSSITVRENPSPERVVSDTKSSVSQNTTKKHE